MEGHFFLPCDMENKEIKIGKSTFSRNALRKLTLKNAKEKFYYLDGRIVSSAWEIANPEKEINIVSKKKSKTENSEKLEKNVSESLDKKDTID